MTSLLFSLLVRLHDNESNIDSTVLYFCLGKRSRPITYSTSFISTLYHNSHRRISKSDTFIDVLQIFFSSKHFLSLQIWWPVFLFTQSLHFPQFSLTRQLVHVPHRFRFFPTVLGVACSSMLLNVIPVLFTISHGLQHGLTQALFVRPFSYAVSEHNRSVKTKPLGIC